MALPNVRLFPQSLGSILCFFILLLTPALGQESEKTQLPSQEAYRHQLQIKRQEGWLGRNIRTFRTYPHLDQAYKLMKADQLPAARQEMEKFLSKDPQDLQARYTYLVLLARLHDQPEVIRQADIILENKPGFIPALLYRGLARQKLGQTPAALADFRAVAQTEGVQPQDRRFALEMVASLSLQHKDYAGVLAALDTMSPPSAQFGDLLTRGFALEGLNRLPEAAEAFRQAASAGKKPSETRQAFLALGELRRKMQDWRGATQAYHQALEISPQDPALMRELARLAYAQKDFQASSEWLSQAQKIAPDPRDQEFLINVWEAGKNYQAAAQEIQNRLKQTTDTQERFELYLKLGHTYNKLGKSTQALEAFRNALRLKNDLPTLTALANTLEKMGHVQEAFQVFQEIARRDPQGGHFFTLGELASRLGQDAQALDYFSRALQGPLPPSQKLAAYKQIGFLASRQQNYPRARQALEQALKLSPQDIGIYSSLSDIAMKMGDYNSALAYQQRLATLLGAQHHQRADVLENLGYLYAKSGQYEAAAQSFQQAIAAGQDSVSLRLDLGYLYLKMNNIPAALENFLVALKLDPQPATFLAVGRCYKELQQPGAAIFYLSKARSFAASLPKADQIDLFSTLGYLYAQTSQYIPAALCFSRSLQLHYDPVIALRLARMERLVGQTAQALAHLNTINPARLPANLQTAYHEEKAAVLQDDGDLPGAVEQYQKANALTNTADHHYRLGLLFRELKQTSAAIEQLQEANTMDPQDNNFTVALGYAYLKDKNYARAAPLLEEVLGRDPDYLSLYADLGYIHMKLINNDDAVSWFKRAIDNRPLHTLHDPQEAERLDQDIYAFRKEITKITNRFDLTVYLSYRSSKTQQFNVPGGLLGGSILADNGVELAYQPPVIGFRDERIFQGFVRVMWGNEPASLNVDGDTFQGGAGVRYKPLKTQNLWLSGERLFKIGNKAMNDWLLRILYSWDDGYDLKYNKPYWNYTFFYAEGDYFCQGIWAYYLEARQGITFNYNNKFLVTPHIIANMRYQDPCYAASSYVEGGAGLSLKYLYNETHYEINRSSLELLIHYRYGKFINQGVSFDGTTFNGVTVLLVNRF